MKAIICINLCLLILCSCSKNNVDPETGFTKYTIKQGRHSSDLSYQKTSLSELRFLVKFDSTAIYQTKIPNNQYDINKLYGFSDNDADHQQYSARFGWRWSDNALRMFAYNYNNGIRDSANLGVINIGVEYNCSIKVTPEHYIFSLNSRIESMARKSTTPVAIGYKLTPYFGGEETAPHDINIFIKEF